MRAKMSNLTDEQLIDFINYNIELRKQLIGVCEDYVYSGLEGSILIYSTKDFVRVSKLLNVPFTISALKNPDNDLKYEATLDYNGFTFLTYATKKGEFLDE